LDWGGKGGVVMSVPQKRVTLYFLEENYIGIANNFNANNFSELKGTSLIHQQKGARFVRWG
jgi:hypothetical protein